MFVKMLLKSTQILQMRFYFWSFLLLLGATYLPTIIQAQQQQQTNQSFQSLSQRNMNFAFKLYKLMADQPDAMLSPLIISIALTMTSFGAGSNTLKQLYDALDLNGFSDRLEIAKGYSAILKSLEVQGETSAFILNRVAIRQDVSIKKALMDILVNDFGIRHVPVHYSNNDVQVVNNNSCTEQTTRFNFTAVLSFNSGNAVDTALHLASVVYFNGRWVQQFCQENTRSELFHGTFGNTQSIPMMSTRAQFHIVEDEFLDAKILRLDYTGNRFALYVILPNQLEGFQAVKKNLDAERFRNIKNNMHAYDVIVKLPKYLGDRLQFLHLDLKNLGITDLENEMSADLREMTDAQPSVSGNLFSKQVLYNAHLELGNIEHPSKAVHLQSVYSAVSVNDTAGTAYQAVSYTVEKKQNQVDQPLAFEANHPFVFIIHDALTDLILFMGNLDNFAKVSYRV